MQNVALSVRIRPIDSLSELTAYRGQWDKMYWADRHASPFLHWAWQSAWFKVTPYPWMVLVAMTEDGSECLGFMPVSYRGTTGRHRFDQLRELHMAGDPAADYNGFLCAARSPQWERATIEAFARSVTEDFSWDHLRLKEMDDPRLDWFIQAMPDRGLRLTQHQGTCCPRLTLPSTWNEYLRECLTPESRKSLKRRIRIAEPECETTFSNPADIEQSMRILHQLAVKQRPALREDISRSCATLRGLAQSGCVQVSILWHGGIPIAAQGSIIDWKRKSIGHSLATYDAAYASLSPGRVLDGLCIREAIDRKMHEIDFLRGDEPYKFQFGARAHYTRHIRAERKGFEATTRRTLSFVRESLRI